MTERKTIIDLKSLLPDLPDARDACVARLTALIGEGGGVGRVHLVHAEGEGGREPSICLHYDPGIATLAQVERLARAAGLEVSERYGHAILPLRLIDGEDAARRVERLHRTVTAPAGRR